MTTHTTFGDPPKADRKHHEHSHHGIVTADPYAWLQDPGYPTVTDPEVLDYLQAENAYFERCMAPHQSLVDTLFAELKARKSDNDASVPYFHNGFHYQWRFTEGDQYRRWYRAAGTHDLEQVAPEQWTLLIDENSLAEGHDYFRLGALSVSPNNEYLAYSVDNDGSERFTLYVINLQHGSEITVPITDTMGDPVWNKASDGILYRQVNAQWRPDKIYWRKLLSDEADTLICAEEDGGFFLSMHLSQSEQLVFLHSADHVTSEVRFLPADDFSSAPTLICPRETGHEYEVEHYQDQLLIRSNKRQANFDLYTAPLIANSLSQWQVFLAGDATHYLLGQLVFDDQIFVPQRIDGLDQILVISADNERHFIELPEATYSLDLGTNPNPQSSFLRLQYSSLTTPHSVMDYDIAARTLKTRKVQQIPSGYDAHEYQSERLMATARDGQQVPISLVYKRDTPRDGNTALHLYAYGAYGHAIPPAFSTNTLSLLDRGVIFAIAHIRGGDDLGYHWYQGGKLQQRENTFNDFVDCTRHLIREGYTSAGRVLISGGSAGGELMGAVINQAPELYAAVVAHVPFVDVLNTMLNPDLPLTPMEWPEWGNPIDSAEDYAIIQAYSPYDQVTSQAYPPMLVTAGLNDPRVTYWEPAKWVAKLRHEKTDDNLLLLKTNMEAGHGGQSGRFTALREVAEEYAFFLTQIP
ncbi:MAG TPA: S9 family peptidase [Gammaproteobacteria bacterium]|nr:S9 family peptidase [Gammaproteobacteria bacterium]